MRVAGCPLCEEAGGRAVFEAPAFRVIHAAEEGFPAFYRVVWKDHVAEWSDLAPQDRGLCMDAVVAVEQCLRDALSPAKINLAALGNMVPHLHWHVIARFEWDTHFPSSVWAAAQRGRDPQREAAIEAKLEALEQDMARRLAAHPQNRSS
ncbi:HIT family protein [Variovorax sp. PBS-H4]|uniref:HIT family protein n=1 Tax=Variovorax sp. PBS-H4 TaxID=434008 RepID=UPI003FCCB8D4